MTTAVTQSELYSLTLNDIGLQSQGLKYLCEVLISYDCCSTSLNISDNRLGDEGLIHLCNVLISVNCKLTNLTVTGTFYGKIGLKHLCDALISQRHKSSDSLLSLLIACQSKCNFYAG